MKKEIQWMGICIPVIMSITISPELVRSQHAYQVLVDINQIHRDELKETARLKCDGVWSIPGNSAADFGRAIPLTEWQAGFDSLGPGWVCTEDYWKNFPHKCYDLTEDIVGDTAIQMVCVYAEGGRLAGDTHENTVVSDSVIDAAYEYTNKPIIALTRDYRNANWISHFNRAMQNPKVGGMCFETKPHVQAIQYFNLINGMKAALATGKKCFLLLYPHYTSVSVNFTYDVLTVYQLIKAQAPGMLDDPDFHWSIACYNRLQDKATTFLAGDDKLSGGYNSIEKAIGMLMAFKVGDMGLLNPPDRPEGLTAVAEEDLIRLDWEDPHDANIAYYNVYRSFYYSSGTLSPAFRLGSTDGPVSSFTDSTVTAGRTYFYQVAAVSRLYIVSERSARDSATVTNTAVKSGAVRPSAFRLMQNVPNPFNPSTAIRYQLSTAGRVRLEVFDVTGRVVSVLAEREQSAGNYRVEFDGSPLTSGVYYYRLWVRGDGREVVQVKKMALVK